MKTFTYRQIANFAWLRAHAATTEKARTFWFDVFDCACGLEDTFGQRSAA